MKSLELLIVASLFTLISAKTESFTTTAVPFQLISPAEYRAILELNNGNPLITQNRLLNSGSQEVNGIISNIVNGQISPLNINGLDAIFSSLLKPASGNVQGYPFCAIQTNRKTQHAQRSYDTALDPASNFGTFSINFFHPGIASFDNYDEDISIDESEPDYHHQKPSQAESSPPTPMANYSPTIANKDKPNDSIAPVINCIVVLKEPSQAAPTTTPTPVSTERPPMRPSFYPQYPTGFTPPHPRDPPFSIGSYQVVPIPYPPYLGLVGPSAAGTSNWPGSQAFAINNPGPAIPPTWPFWSVASPSQAYKNPTNVPTWPYSAAIPALPANTQLPTTAPYIPSPFWAAINSAAAAPHAAASPSISINPNPAAWFRPPVGAYNPNHLMQQPHQQQQKHPQYNGNSDDTASAIRDGNTPENKETQPKSGNENAVGTIQVKRTQSMKIEHK